MPDPIRDELIVDLFAGGGGASQGIWQALGRHPDIAVNHDPLAIGIHRVNHPDTHHACASVWHVEPRRAVAGRPVGLLWASPDCRHFSRAAGGRPRWASVRSLPGVVITWATRVRPRVIVVENVREMLSWGPLLAGGTPDPDRIGRSWNWWIGRLRGLGYRVQWRALCAADFGAPTIRTRLFVVARCDGAPIVWPAPTHARQPSMFERPWRTAAECIDWSIPCPSVFTRPRPLADATLRRIADGVRRYVLGAGEPFIVSLTHHGGFRGQALTEPLATLTCANRGEKALVAASIAQHNGGAVGRAANEPLSAITTRGTQQQIVTARLSLDDEVGARRVAAFLISYYGQGAQHQDLRAPLGTVTTRDRFALVIVDGVPTPIVDIGMRMLTPAELAHAQGFPDGYALDHRPDGTPVSKTHQVRLIGNSVCPPVAEAVVLAQFAASAAEAQAA